MSLQTTSLDGKSLAAGESEEWHPTKQDLMLYYLDKARRAIEASKERHG